MEKEIVFHKIKKFLYWTIYIALMVYNIVILGYEFIEWYYVITDYDYWCREMTMFGYGTCDVPMWYHIYGIYLMVISIISIFLGSWLVYKKKKYALFVVAIDFSWTIICQIALYFHWVEFG